MKKIESFSEYQSEYQKSIDNPELFWEEKANTFNWRDFFSICFDLLFLSTFLF